MMVSPRDRLARVWVCSAFIAIAGCPATGGGVAVLDALEDADLGVNGVFDVVDTIDAASGEDAAFIADAPAPDVEPQVPFPWAAPPGVEGDEATCANGVDDDDNSYTDCADRNCTDHPWVWVCGTLENGPVTCADGVDNPEAPLGSPAQTDGLIDCDDPDCSKNPYLNDVCPSAPPEGYGSGSCADLHDNDGDGITDCDDLDCLLAPESPCGAGGRVRVLFDGAHGQSAGGADWLVDTAVPFPRPSNPDLEREWSGKYSYLGLVLVKRQDFVVATLPRGQSLTWTGSGVYDLSRFDVLVLPEPSSSYAEGEAAAIGAFVQAGGGLLMVGNHEGADRDNNGVDAVKALNDMLTSWSGGGLNSNPLGLWYELLDYDAAQALDAAANSTATFVNPAGHPALSGPGGSVDALGMYVGTTIGSAASGPATPLVWPLNPTNPSTGAVAVASTWGSGRVIAIADSALFSDRTDSHGLAGGSVALDHSDNLEFAINTFYWLGQR